MKDKITIGACWDGKDYYPVEYVNKLYGAVERNTTHPFDFVLYVGADAENRRKEIDDRIRVYQTGLPYWWSGMVFWRKNPPEIYTETLLYLDLDIVILGNIDEIIEFPSNQAYMKNGKTNVSVSLIRNGAGAKVWEEYDRLGRPQWNPLMPPTGRLLPLAAQSVLDDPKMEIKYDFFSSDVVCSYKDRILKTGIPSTCKIVVFHGRPKPHECKEQWIKENWI